MNKYRVREDEESDLVSFMSSTATSHTSRAASEDSGGLSGSETASESGGE